MKDLKRQEMNVDRMKLVTLLLPEAHLEGLDELVRQNMYPSRSEAIRVAVRDLLRREIWTR
ncbi:MAG: ribbon-helix-helix protein, CopG family [Candidatus Bathyarchaeota archaeon]|nr:ribbon-helix-helix protein, CopG family [Candidatus Bathyarchaeota archaeon]